ncbi:MAG: SMC-Scp complex subunit ScpB [Nitrospinae bacterium]|nr:SMC-Scp complex subunit ScpB [Nitrospinota bacterium]
MMSDMDPKKGKAIIENLLLVADRPLTFDNLIEVFKGEFDKNTLEGIMEGLISDYIERDIQIIEIAKGYQLCTRYEYSEWVKRFHKIDKGSVLSKASLDALSIIAYKQPITKAEIEDIRGVDTSGVLKALLERNLIRILGRKKVIGRPIMYGTSRRFMEYFGLKSLSDLPTIEEVTEEGVTEEALMPTTVETNRDEN